MTPAARWALGIGGALWLSGCGGGTPAAGPREFTDDQMKARFAWDLGVDRLDVSGYPAAQRRNYEVFLKACSGCHTPARALNAPVVSRAQWTRFAHRMHFRARSNLLTAATAKAVVDFLVHDAAVRKTGRRDAYLDELARLQSRYGELEVERARRLLEEGARAAKDRGYVSP